MRLHLHIARVVVDGLPGAEAPSRLGSALHDELVRLLESGGLSPTLAAGSSLAHLPAPPLQAGGDAATLGRAIAHSVHSALGTPASSHLQAPHKGAPP